MSVTAAKGFRAAGVAAGLKSSGGSDVALVVNDGPSDVAAAVYTSNRCQAHPVLWSRQVTADGRVRAVLLNSGGANCYTGPRGFQTTHAAAEAVAERLGCGAAEVVVCSTGVIGEQLDRDRLLAGVDSGIGALSGTGGLDAAAAIMTTDTRPKQASVARDGWTVGGMAKGAGMLAPGLATMLVVLTTDAEVDASTTDKALRAATRVSFDRIDSDGCMSTNDTVVLLASGAAGVAPAYDDFTAVVTEVCRDLARQLIGDAEGAEHDVAVEVVHAATEEDAVEVGRTVARNNLLKCAIFGNDPYWGRVIAALGTSGAAFDPTRLDVAFNGVLLCRDSVATGETVDISGREVTITVDLKAGDAAATVWTNDLTQGYVHENSAYTT